MGNWNIIISGHGQHHNSKPEDAEALAAGFVRTLSLNGHGVSLARLVLTNGDGSPCEGEGATTELRDLPALPSTEPLDPIMQFFVYEHLPPHLRAVSALFGELAKTVVATLPRNAERTVTLRKILEAKDAAVRAKMAKP